MCPRKDWDCSRVWSGTYHATGVGSGVSESPVVYVVCGVMGWF